MYETVPRISETYTGVRVTHVWSISEGVSYMIKLENGHVIIM